jgi:uncharacterized membrane protein (Fun14 family)
MRLTLSRFTLLVQPMRSTYAIRVIPRLIAALIALAIVSVVYVRKKWKKRK